MEEEKLVAVPMVAVPLGDGGESLSRTPVVPPGYGEWQLMKKLLSALVQSSGHRSDGTFTAEEMIAFFVAKGACSSESNAGKLLAKLRESDLISPVNVGTVSLDADTTSEKWKIRATLDMEDSVSEAATFPERFNSDPQLLKEWGDAVGFLEKLPARLDVENSTISLHAKVARHHRYSPPVPEEKLERIIGFRGSAKDAAVVAMLEALGVSYVDEKHVVLDMDVLFSLHVAVSHLATEDQVVAFLWRLLHVPGCASYSESLTRLLSVLKLPLADVRWTERLASLISTPDHAFEADTFEEFSTAVLPKYVASLQAPSSIPAGGTFAYLGDFVADLGGRRNVSEFTLAAVNDAVVFDKAERLRLSVSKIDDEEKRARVEALIIEDQFDSSNIYIKPRLDQRLSKKSRYIAIAIVSVANLAMFFGVFASMFVNREQYLSVWESVVVVKAFSSLVILNSALVFLLVSRVALTWISHAWPAFLSVLSAHRWVVFHASAAVVLIASGYIHGLVWLGSILPAVFGTVGVAHVPAQFLYITDSPSQAAFVFGTGVGITGFLLLLVFTILLITTIPRIMRKKFEVFIFFHQFMWVAVGVLLMTHACFATGRPFPLITIFLGPALAWYVIELCIRIWRISHTCRIVFHEVLPGNDYHHLLIDSGKWKFSYKPADYVKLCIPSVSRLQWHPFSIASRPEEQYVRLLIKSTGDWTRKLCDVLNEPNVLPIECRLDGPYESPTRDPYNSLKAEVMVVFAAGVGVSLYAGQVAEWIRCGKKVEMVWVDRDFLGLAFLRDELNRAYPGWREEDNLHARVFCTRSANVPPVMGAVVLMNMYQAEFGYNPIIGLPVVYGRPQFDKELTKLERKYQKSSFAVFCCGPKIFSDEIEKAIDSANLRGDATWNFSPEIFSFTWTGSK